MPTRSKFSREQKKAIVQMAQEKGREAAGAANGVSAHTVSSYAKELGLKLKGGGKVARKKRKKRATVKAANGHAAPAAQRAEDLGAFETELTVALECVRKLRAAYQRVFG
jgi:transposase-like protein